MKLSELARLLANRVQHLEQQKTQAEGRGDVPEVLRLDGELDETRATLETLKAA